VKKSAFFFRSNRPRCTFLGQKRPKISTKTQCERIPSPRGHQLQVKNRLFLVFLVLFFCPNLNHWFSENSDGLIKTFALRRDATFFHIYTIFCCLVYMVEFYEWKKRFGVLALWPVGMSKKSIFINFYKIF
jgi:hypothetical protein